MKILILRYIFLVCMVTLMNWSQVGGRSREGQTLRSVFSLDLATMTWKRYFVFSFCLYFPSTLSLLDWLCLCKCKVVSWLCWCHFVLRANKNIQLSEVELWQRHFQICSNYVFHLYMKGVNIMKTDFSLWYITHAIEEMVSNFPLAGSLTWRRWGGTMVLQL